MPFLVKTRGQPSSYDQRYLFWNDFAFWGAKKWDLYRVTDNRLFFGNKQYSNDVKKHTCCLFQFLQGQMLYLLDYKERKVIYFLGQVDYSEF